jgi:hypothetical protein
VIVAGTFGGFGENAPVPPQVAEPSDSDPLMNGCPLAQDNGPIHPQSEPFHE